ncbi:MAG: hypothetical protein GC190_03350 [Alphaproteobacteria bacterium]|nr:hypothetical protein [Alphaproteobacteria bacterium]
MRIFLVASFGLMLSAVAANADSGPCPATVTDDGEPPGAGSAQMEHRFKDVGFYLGDPKDNDGVPSDDDSEKERQLEQHWELTRVPGKPITMVCRYHGTDKTYVSTVPNDVKGCVLSGEMNDRGDVLGSPDLTCK